MKVKVEWDSGLRFLATPDSGHSVILDSAEGDSGPRPMETVLIALGGCTGMDVVSILKKMRVPFEAFWMEIEAERAPTHPKVYTHIVVRYRFKGQDLPLDKLERSVQLSTEKYCSVMAMLRCTAKIETKVEIVP